MDKEAYLRRINYTDDLSPSLKVLTQLQKAHLISVPFENLEIHNGNLIILATDLLFKKIITNKRGGFCYELNGLFHELLISLGFDTKMVSARVYDPENGYGKEFDHLALTVTINHNKYLADVGFGEFSFAPLMIKQGDVQYDERGEFMLDRYEGYWQVNKKANNRWIPEYIFKDMERKLADFEDMCHFQQTSTQSHFTQKRLISIPTEKGRITLTDQLLKIKQDGSVREYHIENNEVFDKALWKYFKINLNE